MECPSGHAGIVESQFVASTGSVGEAVEVRVEGHPLDAVGQSLALSFRSASPYASRRGRATTRVAPTVSACSLRMDVPSVEAPVAGLPGYGDWVARDLVVGGDDEGVLAMAWAMMMRSKGSRWMSGSWRTPRVARSSMGRESMRWRCRLIVMYLSGVSDRRMCPFPYLETIAKPSPQIANCF